MKQHYPRYNKKQVAIESSLTARDRELLASYLQFCGMTAGPSRLAKYRRYLLHFRDIVEKPLDSISQADAIAFWGLVKNAPYEEHTKIEIRKVVRRFLKWHYRDLDMLEPLKVPSNYLVNKRRVNKSVLLTEQEIQNMLHGAERLRDKALLVLLYETAGRPQEIRDLRWGDISWQQKEIHLYSKKTNDDRDLPVHEAIKHLKRWKSEWAYSDPQESDYIFPSIIGSRPNRAKSISVSYINRIIKSLARKAGIERNVYPYLLRHTRLTELRCRGVQGIEFNKFAGHQPGSKHENVYIHLDNNDMKQSIIQKVYGVHDLPESERDQYEKRIRQLEQQAEHTKQEFAALKEMNARILKLARDGLLETARSPEVAEIG